MGRSSRDADENQGIWSFGTDDDGDDELDPDADLTASTWVSCPYCGEQVEVLVDPSGGAVQEYVEDCEICCNPWNVRVYLDDDGNVSVSVTTQDEE